MKKAEELIDKLGIKGAVNYCLSRAPVYVTEKVSKYFPEEAHYQREYKKIQKLCPHKNPTEYVNDHHKKEWGIKCEDCNTIF